MSFRGEENEGREKQTDKKSMTFGWFCFIHVCVSYKIFWCKGRYLERGEREMRERKREGEGKGGKGEGEGREK